jgi:hypothetical protein
MVLEETGPLLGCAKMNDNGIVMCEICLVSVYFVCERKSLNIAVTE